MKAEIITDKMLTWFEWFIDSPRVERAQVYVLCVIIGLFLGYFYFRFQTAV